MVPVSAVAFFHLRSGRLNSVKNILLLLMGHTLSWHSTLVYMYCSAYYHLQLKYLTRFTYLRGYKR